MRVVWIALCALACSPEPAARSASERPVPMASAPAQSSALPTPIAAAPSAPPSAPASAVAEAPKTDPSVGFDAGAAPQSKMALIDAIDAALRSGDLDTLLASVPDGGPLVDSCVGRVEPEIAASARISLADGMRACHELADFRQARRVALNFGPREWPFHQGCPDLNGLEKSELFYAVGDRVLKVTLKAIASSGGYAATALRCVKKRSSPRDLERLPVNCPRHRWTRITQSGGRCP